GGGGLHARGAVRRGDPRHAGRRPDRRIRIRGRGRPGRLWRPGRARTRDGRPIPARRRRGRAELASGRGGGLIVQPNLDLWPIGNCAVSALIDRQGRFVWACAPRVDGDPVFSALMNGEEPEHGYWAIELEGLKRVSQAYVRNTPVLRTVLTAEDGSAVEIIDFAPRHPKHSRTYRPLAFGRVVRPLQGTPRIRVRLRPSADWGARPAPHTSGSNHIRFICPE